MNKILFVAIMIFASISQAAMFKCKDASGKTGYQDAPCAEGSKAENSRFRPKSNLPCNIENVDKAEKSLGVYIIGEAVSSIYSARSGGDINQEINKFRRASTEGGSIPVPECMEHARDVMRQYLDLTADKLSAMSKGRSYESLDTRSANLKTDYSAAIDAARKQARDQANVWGTSGK